MAVASSRVLQKDTGAVWIWLQGVVRCGCGCRPREPEDGGKWGAKSPAVYILALMALPYFITGGKGAS